MKYTSSNGCLFYYDRILYSWRICEPTMLFLLGFEAITIGNNAQSDKITISKYAYQQSSSTLDELKEFDIYDEIYNYLSSYGSVEDTVSNIKYDCYGLKLLMNELTGIDNDRTVPIIFKNDINRDKIGDLSNIEDKDVLILTSSDNERPFVNLDKILNGYDKYIGIKPTDTVFFLDSITDATEKAAVRICDSIARCGAEVVTLSKNNITYHASSEDLMLMLDLINPKYYFPVMGEYRFQVANANIASLIGIPKENILLKQNGDVVEFDNGVLKESNEHIEVNDIMIDGTASEDIGELVLKDREMLSDNGIVIVCATLDKKSKEILAGPAILTRGFVYVKDSGDMIKEIERISKEKIIENTNNNYVEFNKIKNSIRDEVGKYLYYETECKPMIITVIQEI